MQWFDRDEDGKPGDCSKWHGYDRSIHFEFTGTPDQHGWLVDFGGLKSVKSFLEYYFDHTALAPADDPRMADILAADKTGLVELRVLPYGVSMEMSALFIWEQVNPYIYRLTNGRSWISRVECREHDNNSAFVEFDKNEAVYQAEKSSATLICQPIWSWVEPAEVIKQLSQGDK